MVFWDVRRPSPTECVMTKRRGGVSPPVPCTNQSNVILRALPEESLHWCDTKGIIFRDDVGVAAKPSARMGGHVRRRRMCVPLRNVW